MIEAVNAVLSMGGLALVAGLGLGYASVKFHVEADPIVDKINDMLPATNCGLCGYPGCMPYAEAVVNGEEINLCTPGGKQTMEALATELGREPKSMGDDGPRVAYIHEDDCIGCTACIKVCPVDAIIGANKQSHTVIAVECTSCEKCIEPCPTDCITMEPVVDNIYDWQWQKPSGPHGTTVH
uniref:Ion-translocating oxidoreductase complex subunit B n=1 Tax=Magnetococcus massalia (strain MO-1) TaxID=451514 RepID=A0A1S7LMK5_MAGMO|nr:Electron transport complex protein rnfB [Candidatus Magnetococcus massalia]